jgi:hypothetical protein
LWLFQSTAPAGNQPVEVVVNDFAYLPLQPGDYTHNGAVDAADYVLWRKYNNTATTLPNDSTPGTDSSDYNVWRSHFGQTAGSGTGAIANAAVPEPAMSVLLMFAAAGWCLRRRRAA